MFITTFLGKQIPNRTCSGGNDAIKIAILPEPVERNFVFNTVTETVLGRICRCVYRCCWWYELAVDCSNMICFDSIVVSV